MIQEQKHADRTDAPSPGRCLTLSPWIVLVAGLVLYGLTLNHWVTLSSLPVVSQVTGWDWHPGPLLWRPGAQQPLLWIVTSPVRLLPAGWRPLAMNIFTAICASLTLAILARTVRLLPQDRTKEQRMRLLGDYGLLHMPTAFLPSALAVLMLALCLPFWQNAVTATGEMLDLLVFAFLILCLLEFRISQSANRMYLFALAYGLGVPNNWALVGFFPCFLLAVIWLKGRSFFNLPFILRMAGLGLAGLLVYLVLPLKGAVSGDGGFWPILHLEMGKQLVVLKFLPRWLVLVVWAPILLPLLFAAIRWPSFEGEVNPGANNLTLMMFRLIHLVFLALTALMFFPATFSPNPQRMGLPGFLSFHYLAALGVGYFSGYVLLVFGRQAAARWARAAGVFLFLNRLVFAALWLAAIGLPIGLLAKSLPGIQTLNSDVIPRFAELQVQNVPPAPALLLGDDAARLHLASAALQRQGKLAQYVMVETASLTHPDYLRYLAREYPLFKTMLVEPDKLPKVIGTEELADLMYHIAMRKPVYYLHPSVGYFLERTRFVPHGLGGDLEPYTTNATPVQVQTMSREALDKNQAFWRSVHQQELAHFPDVSTLSPEVSRIAAYYSQTLNDWGVELQKADTRWHLPGLLAEAGQQFAEAFKLNPLNYMAQFNLQYNARLRGVTPLASAGQLLSADSLIARVTDWMPVLNADGVADEPDLDTHIGRQMAVNRDLYQAAQTFQRALQLRPDDANVELDLAKCYIDMGVQETVGPAFELLRRIRQQVGNVSDEVVRVEALAYTKNGELGAADQLLASEQSKHPNDERFLEMLVRFYRSMGYLALRSTKPDAADHARNYFTKALAAAKQDLQMLNSPTAPSAIAQHVPDAMLTESELQMMLQLYGQAIDTLKGLVQLDSKNPIYRLNLAIAELQAGKIEAAKADYLAVLKLAQDNPLYMVYFGLGEIAQKQANSAEAAGYYRLYLKYAPQQTPEYTNVTQQLRKVEGH